MAIVIGQILMSGYDFHSTTSPNLLNDQVELIFKITSAVEVLVLFEGLLWVYHYGYLDRRCF